MIVGVTWRLFFYPCRKKKDRDKIRSEIFAVGQSELSVVEQILHLHVGNWFFMANDGNVACFSFLVSNALVLYFFSKSRVSDY